MADLIAIDGNSIMNRSFYGLPPLKNSKGMYTNAVYGFINILHKLIEEEKPKFAAVAFDLKKPTFRHLKYTEYKAGRRKMPDELAEQMVLIKKVLKIMNVKIYEFEGFEADDILGSLASTAEKAGLKTTIMTGDRDALQLVSSSTTVKIPTNKGGNQMLNIFDLDNFQNTYGITPEEFIDLKALMGDSSDNIPGVPSVGEKTALKLIKECKSLDNLYCNIESYNIPAKTKAKLIEFKDQAYLSKDLATIVKDMEGICIGDCQFDGYDEEELYNLFKELEFNTLIDRFNLKKSNAVSESNPLLSIKFKDADSNILKKLKNKEVYYYIDYINNIPNKLYISFDQSYESVYFEKDADTVKAIFEDNSIKKVGYDAKQDIIKLNSWKVNYSEPFFDVMIAAYIAEATVNKYDLDTLVNNVLKMDTEALSSTNIETRAATILVAIDKLHKLYKNIIAKNNQEDLFYKIEMPLVNTLAEMEMEGFKVNITFINELGEEIDKNINILVSDIYELAGEEFNINSPKQLGVILFEKLNLPTKAKTKTGYSTSIEVLNKLAEEHPIIEKIIKYRQLAKLKSTYIDGIKASVDSENKIHSNFNQAIVATGRISSTEPNLQNIPIKLEQGKLIRKAFVPSDDKHILIDADYSQIELRILAHLSEDMNLIDAFKNDLDIHKMTAAKIFNVELEQVTSAMRSNAKAVNFGIVYGISDFGLGKELSIPKKEAKNYIDSYFEKYPKIKEFMDSSIEFAQSNEFVETIFKRRRYITDINSKNFMIREGAHRIAINTPVQGSAADIIKIAMVNVQNRLKKEELKSKLILQVHDELIIDALKSEKEKVRRVLKEEMERAAELLVKLVADINEGENWYDAK